MPNAFAFLTSRRDIRGGCQGARVGDTRDGGMRRALGIAIVVFMIAAAPGNASTPLRTVDLISTDGILRWINGYRHAPEPSGVPDVVKALSRMGAFKEPEAAGAYVGFVAGVIGSSGPRAEALIARMFPLPEESHWVVVRAIAYSEHPEWKRLLRAFAERMPARQVMIDRYLAGQSPRLFQVESKRTQSWGQRVRYYFSYGTYFGAAKKTAREALDPSPEVLDAFWGYYFATGRYRPISRIIGMLAWSKDNNNVDLLTLGSMAKYTLASNAVRDNHLLGMLKHAAEREAKETAAVLREVIEAAETVETARLRKEALAAIDELRRKGPAYRREVSRWGQVGLGALSLGCIGAAASGMVALGLPCVVGGAVSSAGLRYYEQQQ